MGLEQATESGSCATALATRKSFVVPLFPQSSYFHSLRLHFIASIFFGGFIFRFHPPETFSRKVERRASEACIFFRNKADIGNPAFVHVRKSGPLRATFFAVLFI